MPSGSTDIPSGELAFLDTNILLYAHDKRDPRKQQIALALTEQLLTQNQGVVSTQVLNEFAANALAKLKMTHSEVRRALAYYEQYHVVTHSLPMTIDAVTLVEEAQINFWDALMVVAARSAHCQRVWSEDFNDGQDYGGVRVENPFRVPEQ